LREYKRLNALFGQLPQMKDLLERLREQVQQLAEEVKRQPRNRE